jgi:hypothetical protein
MTRIEIPLSKTKLIIGTIFSILFVVSGYYILTITDDRLSTIHSISNKIFGIAGIIFFGATGIYGIKKMFDIKVGLAIDDNGITDNSNMSSIGLIEWKDITEIKIKREKSTSFLLIFTNNNEKYLEKAKGLKRKLMKANMNKYETPLSIISNTLNCDFEKLEGLINEKLKERQDKMPNR